MKPGWNPASEPPQNEDTVTVKLANGRTMRAWWKGVGWKCGPGQWVTERVVAWREGA